MVVERKNKKGLTMYMTLVLYTLIPLIIGVLLISVISVIQARSEIKSKVTNAMYTAADLSGRNLEGIVNLLGTEAVLNGAFLTDQYNGVKIKGIESSYVYVADADATMLYHPTADKIGQPVTNEIIKGVCANMKAGQTGIIDVATYKFNGEQKYASYYVAPDGSFVLVYSADEADVMSGINKLVYIAIAIAIVLLIIFTVIALLFANKISRPLHEIATCTNEIAEGNLNAGLNAESSIRETRSIISSVERLQSALQNAVGTVRQNALILDESVVKVDSQTAINANGSSQINDAIGEVAETSQSVAESAREMSHKAEQLEASIDQLVNNVKILKQASDSISQINGEASDNMASVMSSSSQSVEAVGGIAKKINETNEAVSRISECVQMIEDIASQTNLLSLNASIEAARAGEAGKGFAVVAEEIRKLADDSQSSATEIREIISRVTMISNETVEAAKLVSDTIAHEQEFIEEAQNKFKVLTDSVESSVHEIGSIQGMAVELNNIKDELTSSISDLSAISEELGASAQEVASTCDTVATACSDTKEKTEEMKEIGASLSNAISVFRL